MEQFTRIGNKMIQRVTTREEIINIEDLERQREGFISALENDALQKEKFGFIKKELEKTNLSEEDKNLIIGRIATAGSGITQEMVDRLDAQIQEFKRLPIEMAVDIIP